MRQVGLVEIGRVLLGSVGLSLGTMIFLIGGMHMETINKYSWKYGNCGGIDANMVGREFEAIERENGSITKQAIVDRARPETSPMHIMFEWNDEIAGELYRLEQAYGYIRRLEVTVVPVGQTNGKSVKMRGYVNVAPVCNSAKELPGVFINADSAISNPETYAIVLARAKRELKTFQNKYVSFAELKPVFDAIDTVCSA